MTQMNDRLAPLVGGFEAVLQRLEREPVGESSRVLASFASALLNSEAYNLAQIDQLTAIHDRDLCLALFDYCMTAGLTEDERHEAAIAFLPYTEIHAPGTRQ